MAVITCIALATGKMTTHVLVMLGGRQEVVLGWVGVWVYFYVTAACSVELSTALIGLPTLNIHSYGLRVQFAALICHIVCNHGPIHGSYFGPLLLTHPNFV